MRRTRFPDRHEPGERIDDGEHAQLLTRCELVVDEVHRPGLVRAGCRPAIIPQLSLDPALRRNPVWRSQIDGLLTISRRKCSLKPLPDKLKYKHSDSVQWVTIMRSNLKHWQELQASGYFEAPTYKDRPDFGDFEIRAIEHFMPLRADMTVVIVGCGYGRESEYIARRVKHVYGIDVSEPILEMAQRHLQEKGVRNFTPILATEYASKIPPGIDLVFSIVVMQHLTRDLVVDYFYRLGAMLVPEGRMVVQFVEEIGKDTRNDAELRVYEPMVNWTTQQLLLLTQLAHLKLEEIRTVLVTETALWHWAYVSRPLPNRTNSPKPSPPSWPAETNVESARAAKSIRTVVRRLSNKMKKWWRRGAADRCCSS